MKTIGEKDKPWSNNYSKNATSAPDPPWSQSPSQFGVYMKNKCLCSFWCRDSAGFSFPKEKRMHHFQSAFAFPLLATALGSKSSPSLSWFPQKVVLPWHVALQKCSVSKFDAEMITNCVFLLFPEFKWDLICTLAPQPVGGALKLWTSGDTWFHECVIYGVSSLKCIPRDLPKFSNGWYSWIRWGVGTSLMKLSPDF